MSSRLAEPKAHSVLASSVFRRAVMAAIASLLVLLALAWLIHAVTRENELDLLRAELSDARAHAEAMVRNEGLQALANALAHDDRRVWDPDDLYFMLEEEEPVVRLLNEADETLAGYPGLDPPGGVIDWYFLQHAELDAEPIIVSRERVADGHELVIARFIPGRILYNDEVLRLATIFLSSLLDRSRLSQRISPVALCFAGSIRLPPPPARLAMIGSMLAFRFPKATTNLIGLRAALTRCSIGSRR